MSGGHWDYSQYRLTSCLEDVTKTEEVRKRWPRSAQILERVSDALGEILHDMDWDLSGDSYIEDDEAFDQNCIDSLRKAVLATDLGNLRKAVGDESTAMTASEKERVEALQAIAVAVEKLSDAICHKTQEDKE